MILFFMFTYIYNFEVVQLILQLPIDWFTVIANQISAEIILRIPVRGIH